jgi:hypothetical protein
MNPLETFGEFAKRLTLTDLALYAGVGIVLWVLFKDQLSPVQKVISDLFSNKNTVSKPSLPPVVTVPDTSNKAKESPNQDVFFNLVVSWKQTRDLAVLSGCVKAVEVADQMFPYLSPVICKEESKNESVKS